MGITYLSMGKLPNGWTNWHEIRYTYVDSSANGHRLKTIRPTIPRGGILRCFGKCQTAGSVGNKFCTYYNAGESGNGHRLNKLTP